MSLGLLAYAVCLIQVQFVSTIEKGGFSGQDTDHRSWGSMGPWWPWRANYLKTLGEKLYNKSVSQQVYYMLFAFHNKSVTYRADLLNWSKNRVRAKIVCVIYKSGTIFKTQVQLFHFSIKCKI